MEFDPVLGVFKQKSPKAPEKERAEEIEGNKEMKNKPISELVELLNKNELNKEEII